MNKINIIFYGLKITITPFLQQYACKKALNLGTAKFGKLQNTKSFNSLGYLDEH